MRILLVHQNFPGQFKHLAPALVEQGHEVTAFTMSQNPVPAGVRVVQYHAAKGTSETVHKWVTDIETKVIRGEAAFRAALQLKEAGYTPDVIVAHPGWGESLFLKDVWPDTKLGIYCEFFYKPEGGDVGFDPEFPVTDPGSAARLRLKNVNNLLHFLSADAGISPTEWQASTFPSPFREKISVIHDGIDTDVVTPSADVKMTINRGDVHLDRTSEVITFVNRNLEPTRGYHIFMRMLPEILARRPNARVMIVGGNDVSYGARPPKGQSYRDIYLKEVEGRIDRSRVHFLGHVPYAGFLSLLQLSTVHVYLTYPFVLSWSLIEAMSAGCAIVASDTAPLHEAIQHNESGRLVDFFDVAGMADNICSLLDNPTERERLGRNAREFARKHYDLRTVCLPRQLAWVQAVAEGRPFA